VGLRLITFESIGQFDILIVVSVNLQGVEFISFVSALGMWKWLMIEPLFTPIWRPEFGDSNNVVDAMLAKEIGLNSSMGMWKNNRLA
jgi:hypothetical protein